MTSWKEGASATLWANNMNGIVTFQVILLQFRTNKLYLSNIRSHKLTFMMPIGQRNTPEYDKPHDTIHEAGGGVMYLAYPCTARKA